jgi:phage gpG-like protein
MWFRSAADIVAVDAKLGRVIVKLGKKRELLEEYGQVGEDGAKMAHAQEATPGGAAWADLKADTWRRKGTGKKVWETGALAGSFVARPPSGNSVEVASEGIPYAPYHHRGTSKMPARRSLPEKPYLMPRMTAIARRRLREAFA